MQVRAIKWQEDLAKNVWICYIKAIEINEQIALFISKGLTKKKKKKRIKLAPAIIEREKKKETLDCLWQSVKQ